MQAVWITRSASPAQQRGVVVFAAGWAGSDELVRHLALPEGYDFLCLFDYRTLPDLAEKDELFALLQPYPERHLAAWSFGVWTAGQVFGTFSRSGYWTTATAINGTPVPIHDTYGIPERGFAVTVRSIGGAGTAKFLERMCGTPEILREYYKHRSTRALEEIYDELLRLQEMSHACPADNPAPDFWTAAIIGQKDAIFPPENMTAYWNAAKVPVTLYPEMPHYPLHESGILARLIHEAR